MSHTHTHEQIVLDMMLGDLAVMRASIFARRRMLEDDEAVVAWMVREIADMSEMHDGLTVKCPCCGQSTDLPSADFVRRFFEGGVWQCGGPHCD